MNPYFSALSLVGPEDILNVLTMILGGSFFLTIFGVLFLLMILWCLVPFAIFGIKPRLDSLIRAVEDLARIQQELSQDIRTIRRQGLEQSTSEVTTAQKQVEDETKVCSSASESRE